MLILWVALAAVAVGFGYVAVCSFWPWGSCRWCRGGRKYSWFSDRYWRDCRRCKGTGRRVRLGRRVWTWLGARKHDVVG